MKNGYLGVDIGSISTKAVVIDDDNNIILSKYIWTEGNPIEAVKKIISEFRKKIPSNIKIVGVGTTGSARRLIGSILNANIVKNEEEKYPDLDMYNILKPNQKLAAFVGTSKNGTSFLVNNVAEILSMNGIDTAILDLTQNRNAYYIYTKNDEDLRAYASDFVKWEKKYEI